MEQTSLPDQWIIIDDGSTDDTMQFLSDIADTHRDLVRIEQNTNNLGSTANFEKAIRRCDGDIIVLSDQDDRWLPNKIERIRRSFEESPELDLYFSDATLINEEGERMPTTLWESLGLTNAVETIAHSPDYFKLLLKGNVVTGATMAFRSRLRGLVLPIETRWVHDGWIAFMAACHDRRLFADPEPTIQYRVHASQQIGVRPVSDLWGRMNHAAAVSHLTLDEEFRRYELAQRVLFGHLTGDDPKIAAISAKLHHLQARSLLKQGKLPRLDLAIRELLYGRYHRYSMGWRSLGIDIVWRFINRLETS